MKIIASMSKLLECNCHFCTLSSYLVIGNILGHIPHMVTLIIVMPVKYAFLQVNSPKPKHNHNPKSTCS